MNQTLNNPKAKGLVTEQPLEKYFELTKSEELAKLVVAIRFEQDHGKRRELKANLPIRCPHYFRFKDNHRSQPNIIPEAFTFQTCVDIDNQEQVEGALERAYLINSQEGQWKDMLLHAEYSASGKLHLDIRIPMGMTIKEAQTAYCKALGIDFDEDCCTPERMIYITDESSQLFTAPDWYAELPEEEVAERRKAYLDRGLTIDGRETASTELRIQPSGNESKSRLVDYPKEYMSIPYEYITDELADQLGGIPVHGSRNSFIYTMACHLRHICNDDPEWIKQVLPTYGENGKRVSQTIESACRRQQTTTMPQKLQAALQLARNRVNIEKGESTDSLMRQPQMPERLPAPIRLCVSKAPKGYHPCIATTVFPAFGTFAGGVKAEFWNNTLMELTLLDGLIAEMSIGKSCIKDPIDHILKPIEARDTISREKEKEWDAATNTKGANADKPERPKDICVQVVDSDMTNAAFCQRMEDCELAGDKAMFTRMDELEEIKKRVEPYLHQDAICIVHPMDVTDPKACDRLMDMIWDVNVGIFIFKCIGSGGSGNQAKRCVVTASLCGFVNLSIFFVPGFIKECNTLFGAASGK